MKTVLTYGTFDLFHIGHIQMLQRLADLGDKLIVGVSTDEFNLLKGKRSVFDFNERKTIISALKIVDEVLPEDSWEQKVSDIQQYDVSIFGIGEDWRGKFDFLSDYCEVVYLPRTPSVSSTDIKRRLKKIDTESIRQIKDGLDGILDIIKALE